MTFVTSSAVKHTFRFNYRLNIRFSAVSKRHVRTRGKTSSLVYYGILQMKTCRVIHDFKKVVLVVVFGLCGHWLIRTYKSTVRVLKLKKVLNILVPFTLDTVVPRSFRDMQYLSKNKFERRTTHWLSLSTSLTFWIFIDPKQNLSLTITEFAFGNYIQNIKR